MRLQLSVFIFPRQLEAELAEEAAVEAAAGPVKVSRRTAKRDQPPAPVAQQPDDLHGEMDDILVFMDSFDDSASSE